MVKDWRGRSPAAIPGAQRHGVCEATRVEVTLEGVAVDQTGRLEDAHAPGAFLPSPGVAILHVHVLCSEIACWKKLRRSIVVCL